MLEEVHGLADKAVEVHLIYKKWTGTRIVEQTANGGGDSLRAFDAAVDLRATFFVDRVLQFHLEVRHDAEQRIVNLVCGTQSQLRKRRVLFVIAELCLELNLFAFEFSLLLKP